MHSTLPTSRIGRDSPAPEKAALPKSARERGRLWSDAVFEAVMALQKQLASRSEAVVAAAANAILELERTRMRHDKSLAGSRMGTACLEDADGDESESEPLARSDDRRPERAEPMRADFPVPEDRRTHDEALAGHAEEVRGHFARTEGRDFTEAKAGKLVADCLYRWLLPSRHVPAGEFVATMRYMGEFDSPRPE